MKHKLYLLVALTLIAFIAITSYTPQTAQAETLMQEDPVSETEEIPYANEEEVLVAEESVILTGTDDTNFLEEDSSKPDADNQINSNMYGHFNAVGINFVPHHSNLTHYNGNNGCLGSNYTGTTYKTWSIPVNIPHNSKGRTMYFTYNNRIENPSGEIWVAMWRRKYNDLTTEKVVEWYLNKSTQGYQYSYLDISNITFSTSVWFYWFEFRIPDGEGNREFCGIQIEYENPPLFPVALPMINK